MTYNPPTTCQSDMIMDQIMKKSTTNAYLPPNIIVWPREQHHQILHHCTIPHTEDTMWLYGICLQEGPRNHTLPQTPTLRY